MEATAPTAGRRLHREYYRTNLEIVLGAARARHDLLHPHEAERLAAWFDLPTPARNLWARLAMRRGQAFRPSRLKYDEIPDLDAAAEALAARGFLSVGGVDADPAWLLATLTLAELAAVGRTLDIATRGHRTEILERLVGAPRLVETLLAVDRYWIPQQRSLLDLARVIFFGNAWQELSELVRVDLAQLRYPRVEIAPGFAVFPTRDDLDRYLDAFAELEADFGTWDASRLATRAAERIEHAEQAAALPPHRRDVDPARLGARVALRAARELERRAEASTAAALHRRLARLESIEPAIRAEAFERWGLLAAVGHDDGFDAESARFLAAADDLSRYRVAVRRARLGVGSPPELRAAREIRLTLALADDSGPRPVWRLPGGAPAPIESTALAALGGGLYAENGLYRSLFGLLFWDVLFAPLPGAFQHAYQSAPLDIGSAGFYAAREAAFVRRFTDLEHLDVATELAAAWQCHHALACQFVAWEAFTLADLQLAAAALGGALLPILERIARRPRRHGHGLPDLFLVREGRAVAVEVKGPGDQLSLEQRLWIDALIGFGVDVRVLRVIPSFSRRSSSRRRTRKPAPPRLNPESPTAAS